MNGSETILDRYAISPIVAVIPDNKDNEFNYQVDPNFWTRVAGWQEKGWAIAMHGYQHLYTTTAGGLIPVNKHSEFAGLPFEEQKEKIRNSWQIFNKQKVRPTVWVAPSHSFDDATLRAITDETGIKIISDGIALGSFFEKGFYWIPQQLWKFKKLPFGTFTICLHPNTMNDNDFAHLERDISTNQKSFICVADLQLNNRPRNIIDRVFALVWWYMYAGKKK